MFKPYQALQKEITTIRDSAKARAKKLWKCEYQTAPSLLSTDNFKTIEKLLSQSISVERIDSLNRTDIEKYFALSLLSHCLKTWLKSGGHYFFNTRIVCSHVIALVLKNPNIQITSDPEQKNDSDSEGLESDQEDDQTYHFEKQLKNIPAEIQDKIKSPPVQSWFKIVDALAYYIGKGNTTPFMKLIEDNFCDWVTQNGALIRAWLNQDDVSSTTKLEKSTQLTKEQETYSISSTEKAEFEDRKSNIAPSSTDDKPKAKRTKISNISSTEKAEFEDRKFNTASSSTDDEPKAKRTKISNISSTEKSEFEYHKSNTASSPIKKRKLEGCNEKSPKKLKTAKTDHTNSDQAEFVGDKSKTDSSDAQENSAELQQPDTSEPDSSEEKNPPKEDQVTAAKYTSTGENTYQLTVTFESGKIETKTYTHVNDPLSLMIKTDEHLNSLPNGKNITIQQELSASPKAIVDPILKSGSPSHSSSTYKKTDLQSEYGPQLSPTDKPSYWRDSTQSNDNDDMEAPENHIPTSPTTDSSATPSWMMSHSSSSSDFQPKSNPHDIEVPANYIPTSPTTDSSAPPSWMKNGSSSSSSAFQPESDEDDIEVPANCTPSTPTQSSASPWIPESQLSTPVNSPVVASTPELKSHNENSSTDINEDTDLEELDLSSEYSISLQLSQLSVSSDSQSPPSSPRVFPPFPVPHTTSGSPHSTQTRTVPSHVQCYRLVRSTGGDNSHYQYSLDSFQTTESELKPYQPQPATTKHQLITEVEKIIQLLNLIQLRRTNRPNIECFATSNVVVTQAGELCLKSDFVLAEQNSRSMSIDPEADATKAQIEATAETKQIDRFIEQIVSRRSEIEPCYQQKISSINAFSQGTRYPKSSSFSPPGIQDLIDQFTSSVGELEKLSASDPKPAATTSKLSLFSNAVSNAANLLNPFATTPEGSAPKP